MKAVIKKGSFKLFNNITNTYKAFKHILTESKAFSTSPTISNKSLANMTKKENFKFNFKEFIENYQLHEMNIKNRKVDVNPVKLKLLYDDYLVKSNDLNLMRQKLNELRNQSKKMAVSGEKLSNFLLKDQVKYNTNIVELVKELEKIESEMIDEAFYIPNNTSLESPVGDETQNKCIFVNHEKDELKKVLVKEEKKAKKKNEENSLSNQDTNKNSGYRVLPHLDIIEKYDLADFDNASKVCGSKFVYFKNELVLLEMALIQYSLNKLRNKGYELIMTPDLVKNEVIKGCGFNPRDPNKNQVYSIDDNELSLIGTSEITIMGLLANEIVNKKDLPIKYAGVSHCYRREAGRGNFSKGLYRLHQFTKIEMFSFTENNINKSEKALLDILDIQKEIYNELGLKYRVLEMATEELGASAFRKFDIESWFPSLNDYGEISSCSNCTDYQSRRLLAQYWDKDEATNKVIKKLLHSINGTAIAIPRIIMGILENHQNEDNEIILPKCLVPFMCGIDKISRKSKDNKEYAKNNLNSGINHNI